MRRIQELLAALDGGSAERKSVVEGYDHETDTRARNQESA